MYGCAAGATATRRATAGGCGGSEMVTRQPPVHTQVSAVWREATQRRGWCNGQRVVERSDAQWWAGVFLLLFCARTLPYPPLKMPGSSVRARLPRSSFSPASLGRVQPGRPESPSRAPHCTLHCSLHLTPWPCTEPKAAQLSPRATFLVYWFTLSRRLRPWTCIARAHAHRAALSQAHRPHDTRTRTTPGLLGMLLWTAALDCCSRPRGKSRPEEPQTGAPRAALSSSPSFHTPPPPPPPHAPPGPPAGLAPQRQRSSGSASTPIPAPTPGPAPTLLLAQRRSRSRSLSRSRSPPPRSPSRSRSRRSRFSRSLSRSRSRSPRSPPRSPRSLREGSARVSVDQMGFNPPPPPPPS